MHSQQFTCADTLSCVHNASEFSYARVCTRRSALAEIRAS